ncbi:hypothetical protein GGS20DRAFT_306012 [Poronia punctata]|nr:hypothetical protein GGS20DRAFT_306012 [Poronia punctata]
MGRFGYLAALILTAGLNVQLCLGQSSAPTVYTDSKTGITFDTWIVPDRSSGASGVGTYGGMTMGFAMPENALSTDANEFIGYLVRKYHPHRLAREPWADTMLDSCALQTAPP